MPDESVALPPVQDLTYIALRPDQLRSAQEGLIEWAKLRCIHLRVELHEQEKSRDASKASGFTAQTASWSRETLKTIRLLHFYEKVGDALEAGYLIVPDFDVELFAVRTGDDRPRGRTTSPQYEHHGEHLSEMQQHAAAIPAGEGKYVSPQPNVGSRDWSTKDSQGREIARRDWWATEFREVAFPGRLIRPEILNATHAAMALKVFDELGIVGTPRVRQSDPIVVGRIIDPRGGKHRTRRVAFFVAWWLDTASL